MCRSFPFLWHNWFYDSEEYIKEEDVGTGKISTRLCRYCRRGGCYEFQYYNVHPLNNDFNYWGNSYPKIENYRISWFIDLINDLVKELDTHFYSQLKGIQIYEIVDDKTFVVFTPNKTYVCAVVFDELKTKNSCYRRWQIFDGEKRIYVNFDRTAIIEYVKKMFSVKIVTV